MQRFWVAILGLVFCLGAAMAQPPGRGGWRVTPRVPVEEKLEPLAWGLPAAAHLMRRAGFSASPEELQRIVDQGLEKTLDELLNFESVDDSALEQALQARGYQLTRTANNQVLRPNAQDLQRLWLYRMLNSRRQLVEKMTFFWHDHFATSVAGVNFVDANQAPLVWVQNEMLRANSLGNFKEMVHLIARDPAMIVWLDNLSNVVGSPNENWARELMELFTMGEGSGYTEADIQEAARAFTGWTLNRRTGQFVFNARAHDFGSKRVLGEVITSPQGAAAVADGDKVVDIVFKQPVVAEFIARKVWNFFVYPNPGPDVIGPVAAAFRDSGYDIKTLMRAVFAHPHFMSAKAYRAKIKSPVEFAVNVFRELGVSDPDNTPRLTEFFGLGQNLYYPPDVGGWTSDKGWINTGTVLARSNYVTCLISNRKNENWPCISTDGRRGRPSPANDQIDLAPIIAKNQLFLGAEFVDYFVRALLQDDVSIDTRYTLEEYLTTDERGEPQEFDVSDPVAVDKKIRGLIYLITLIPAYQLN